MDLNRIWSTWKREGEKIIHLSFSPMIIFLQGKKLYAATVEKDKYIRREMLLLENEGEEDILKALKELKKKGFKEKNVILVYNFPDLKITGKKLPSITKEELEESLYWEQDRIFGVRTDLQITYRVLEEDFTGWKISVTGALKENIRNWENLIRSAGKRLIHICPVTETMIRGNAPCLYIFGGKDRAICLFREGTEEETRIISKKEGKEKWDLFIDHLEKSYETETAEALFIPLSDCDKEDSLYWKSFFSGRKKENMEELSETGKGREDEWQDIMPALISAASSPMDLLPHKKINLSFTKENALLRTGQIMTALFFGAAVFLSFQFLHAGVRYDDIREKRASLTAMKKEMDADIKDRKIERELLEEIRILEKNNLQWKQKLILLSDQVPQGVVLHEIVGKERGIRIKGSADSSASVELLKENTARIWNMKMTSREKKVQPPLKIITFEIRGDYQNEND